MSLPVKSGFPDGVQLPGSYTVRFTAVDPTTGAVVAGVVISGASLLVEQAGGGTLDSGAFMLVPGPSA